MLLFSLKDGDLFLPVGDMQRAKIPLVFKPLTLLCFHWENM